MKELRYYRMAGGRSPFVRWRAALADKPSRARIDARIRRLSAGNLGDCSSVGGGVFELRIHVGPGFRVYFANDGDDIVVLLLGGDESTQREDIEAAKRFWFDYVRSKP